MATKTTKKTTLPKIAKKWYDFKIDTKTLRPIRFAWTLASGFKEVFIYNSDDKSQEDILHLNLRNTIMSYYFVLDKANKRIFAYPIQLTGHYTRSSCEEAHYIKSDSNTFYMFDEDKQIWEIAKREYRKYVRYDWNTRQTIYEDVPVGPKKVSRMSTYYYKIQAQLPSYIREIFSELYGKDFVYQNNLITDDMIRDNSWQWVSWLQTKGRKYSEKTIKDTDTLMNKFNSSQRTCEITNTGRCYIRAVLDYNDDITALCYYSSGKETYRQIFNAKTGKMNDFIWKNDKWQKASKLSGWQTVNEMLISEEYKKTHKYDNVFFDEAKKYYQSNQLQRGWYQSSKKSLYDFILNYISYPSVHQILQIQTTDGRNEMYLQRGDIGKVYGKVPNRGKTLFAKLGVNKYQFENPQVVPYVKWLLGVSNISHIDNQTWDKCLESFKGLGTKQYNETEILQFLKSRGEFSLDRWMKICALHKTGVTVNRYGNSYSPIKQLYMDYYRSLSAISEFGLDISSYPLLFNTQQQLQRYHDEAARAVSSVKNRAMDEKFRMLYDKRQKMLANDGEYLIGMPQSSADLTTEGSYLHHCVGGYTSRVANNETAIYFLRKASEPNTPWLTVEVRNKSCVQIHGACNAWMGSKDEYFNAVPFLSWWFDKHDIQCSDNLLTNQATGYGASCHNRALPIEKIEQYKKEHKEKK